MINVVSLKDGKHCRMRGSDYRKRKASAFIAGTVNNPYRFEYEFECEYFKQPDQS